MSQFVVLTSVIVNQQQVHAGGVCPDGYGLLKYIASNGSKTGVRDSSNTYAWTDYCYAPAPSEPGKVVNVLGVKRAIKRVDYYQPTLVDVFICDERPWWGKKLCVRGHWIDIQLVPFSQ